MKILMIAFGHPDNVFSLCKNIAKKEDLTLVFVMAGDRFQQGILNINISNLNYGLNDRNSSLKVLPEPLVKYIGNDFDFRILRTNSRKMMHDKYFKNLRAIIKSVIVLKKQKYDIIHFNGVSGFIFYFILIFGKIKKIWTIHDFIPHSGEENKKSIIIQKILAKFNFYFIQHYNFLREVFIKEYKIKESKVFQIYSGLFEVYTHFNLMPIKLKEDYILFFGRISKYKGIPLLLEAFNLISDSITVKLVIAGKGDSYFEKGNNKKILFINRYIETEELVYLIKNCLFVIIPYSDATHSATIMTSYSFLKPVIVTAIGGIPEVVIDGETGILVPPNNPRALAFAIQELLNSPEKLSVMSNNIKQLYSKGKFSWENIVSRQINIYRKIIYEE